MSSHEVPSLSRFESEGIAFWTDAALWTRAGVRVCFSERSGGHSPAPYESLNLAAHVGDDPRVVDSNRARLLRCSGLSPYAELLTMAHQVHGETVVQIDAATAGAGAYALEGTPPVDACDALLTREAGVPLLMCFADCVPIVLVAPGPAVAVAHAGWRGALVGLPGKAARALCDSTGCHAAQIHAYVGAHVAACHYEVSVEIMSRFANAFGTVARAESGGLDLGAVVNASLTDAGVDSCSIARLGTCTAETTDRFFSYRAEGGLTGRHGALACILPR